MKAENRRNETNAADPMFVGSLAIVDAETLARNWWVVLLRGIAGIIFGLLTFFAPGISLAALVLLFGAYAFADGILAIVSAIRTRSDNQHWWVLIIEGILGIAAGILTLIWPGITALALLFLIAGWAVATGALEIAAAIRLRKVISHEWLLVLAGIASIAFGILLALFPGPGALAVVIWIGAYALVTGAMMIGLAFRLRSWARSESPQRMAHSVA